MAIYDNSTNIQGRLLPSEEQVSSLVEIANEWEMFIIRGFMKS